MDEETWLACNDPRAMLGVLQITSGDRKCQLFACACCRRIWHLLDIAPLKLAIEAAERYADGLVDGAAVERAAAAADQLVGFAALKSEAAEYAATAAALAATGDHVNESAEAAAVAVGLEGGVAGWEERRDAEQSWQCDILRDLAGNPFRPLTLEDRWRTANVLDLARTIYEDRAFDRLPILADALMDAGCDSEEILSHCRGPGPHVRGCWVVDLVLGKD